MHRFQSGDLLDRTFVVGLVLKGLDGILELAGAVLLLLLSPSAIDSMVRALTQHELSQDAHDLIANYLVREAGRLTGSTLRFSAAYLLLHGAVKVVLVAAVLRNKLWAYPWMIAFLLAFIAYQVYRLTFAPSIALLGLTVFDAAVAWLTYREYLRQRAASRLRHH